MSKCLTFTTKIWFLGYPSFSQKNTQGDQMPFSADQASTTVLKNLSSIFCWRFTMACAMSRNGLSVTKVCSILNEKPWSPETPEKKRGKRIHSRYPSSWTINKMSSQNFTNSSWNGYESQISSMNFQMANIWPQQTDTQKLNAPIFLHQATLPHWISQSSPRYWAAPQASPWCIRGNRPQAA